MRNTEPSGKTIFKTENVIHRDAIGQSVRASGIFGNISADGAGFLAGRIGRVVKTEMFDGASDIEIYDAGLDDGAAIFGVNFKNAIHARKNREDAALAGERAAGESCASAAADEGNLVSRSGADDGGDIVARAREDHALWARLLDRAIVFIH